MEVPSTDAVAADVRLAERPLRRGAHRAGRRGQPVRHLPAAAAASASRRASSRSRPAPRSSRSRASILVVPGAAAMTRRHAERRTACARRPARDLRGLPVEVAPRLLGGVLTTVVDGETVAVRLTEVEAYHGPGPARSPIPGSHARMGRTARNATMWGEPGHLYVYLSHGIHSCVNVVCGPEGVAGGILLRAGEIAARDGMPPPASPGRRRRRDRIATWRADPVVSATRSGCGIRCTTASTRSPEPRARRSGRPALSCAPSPLDGVATGPAGRCRRCRGHGRLPVALLDRRRPDGLRLPLGPRRRARVAASTVVRPTAGSSPP